VSIELIVEMLDHAPAELTPAERLLLVAIAEKANEQTRMSWPGMDTLTQRTGLGDRQVRRMLADLAARGYELRVPIGVDKHGMPVFASKGRRTVYRVPAFRQRRTPTAALKEDAYDRLNDPKADIPGTQRRTYPVAKEDVYVPPSPQEPSKNKPSHRASDPSRNGKTGTDWLDGAVDFVAERLTATTTRTYDRRDITGAVTAFLSGKQVTNPGAYIRKCATENVLQFEPTRIPPRYERDPADEVAR
jgi:hypothetical protein